MRLLGALCALLAAAIWGGMYVASKYVLDYVGPVTLMAMRYAIALVVLGAALRLTRSPLPARRDLPALALLGFVGFGVSIYSQFAGTRLSTAANGALITSATPALVVAFAWWLLREPARPARLVGPGLALVGVLVVSDPAGASLASSLLLGNSLLVLAAVTWALYSVLVRRASRSYPALTITTCAALVGLLVSAPLAPVEWSQLGPPSHELPALAWASILYIGVVSTAGAFYLWNQGLALLDASVAAAFFYAQPVVGALLGWLLLGEPLGPRFFVGGALIFAGVAAASLVSAGPRQTSDARIPAAD